MDASNRNRAWLSELRAADHAIGAGWQLSERAEAVPVAKREVGTEKGVWSNLYQPFQTSFSLRRHGDIKSWAITGYPRIAGAEYLVSKDCGDLYCILFMGAHRSFYNFLKPHMGYLWQKLESCFDACSVAPLISSRCVGYIFLLHNELVFLLGESKFRDAPEDPIAMSVRDSEAVIDMRIIDGVWCFDGWLKLPQDNVAG